MEKSVLKNHPKTSLADFDKQKFNKDTLFIAGLDEVGRGALAGPVVIGLVVIDEKFSLDLCADSKKLSVAKRLYYDKLIRQKAKLCLVESIPNNIIDEINISNAVKLGMIKLMEQASKLLHIDLFLIDYVKFNNHKYNTLSFPRADETSQVVACASVIAKVYRDNLMKEYSKKYPEYGFENNVGYGTIAHLTKLKQVGHCPIHRLAFKGVIREKRNN